MQNEIKTTEVTVTQPLPSPMSEADIKANVEIIQKVQQSVMRDGVHYGKIPGTQKPTLYKSGAEKILMTFRLSADPRIEDLSTDDEVRYRIKCVIRNQDGQFLGAGVGEASSSEDKYKWREAICPQEFEGTPENRRRVKYSKQQGNVQTKNQVRTNPSDSANTILKMAKKRALTDAVLTVTAASDIFDQDLEDLAQPTAQPHPKAGSSAPQSNNGDAKAGFVTDAQINMLRNRLDQSGIPERALFKQFNVISFAELKFDEFNDIVDWIKTNGA